VYTTRTTRHVHAPRAAVYAALLDPDAVASWRVPDGMTSRVHEFEPREGGVFRVSLTYQGADGVGKSGARTDTYHGRFLTLVPDERVVEELEFETSDPALAVPMRMTTSLSDADGGTDVLLVHEGVPDAVPAEENEAGTRMALARLAELVETTTRSTSDESGQPA
jgi:uncharacterized protein YndB with AHSA1/START domain